MTFSPEDVHVEKGGPLKLEHEQQSVQDDQEEDEVFKGGQRYQPPYVVPGLEKHSLQRHFS